MNFEPLLKFGVDQGASAIHFQAGAPPQLRIGGLVRGVEGPPVSGEELGAFLASIAPKSVADDVDRAFARGATFSASAAAGRFRCTASGQVGGPALVLRVVPAAIRGIDELGLPRAVRDVALASRGLVLVVGPSGSGKTTTLAAMVDLINGASHQKVVTVEAPVEYLHAGKKAMVTQMEVGLNAASFEHGLALALEQDPDVVVVGDLRDLATARIVLGAAEAGRKILAAMTGLHTIQAIGRLIALFPREERETAVSQLAAALDGVVAQRLANTRDGKLRPAVEVLRGGLNTGRSIQEGRLEDLNYVMESRQGGMQSLDQSLLALHESGVLSGTETMRLATNPEAVGARLRTLQQAAAAQAQARTAPAPAAAAVAAEPGLQP
jgi:twitching motility protein PilT